MVTPVPVNADIDSKIPLSSPILVTSSKVIPPINAAHSHANEEIAIPCLRRMCFVSEAIF